MISRSSVLGIDGSALPAAAMMPAARRARSRGIPSASATALTDLACGLPGLSRQP